MSNSTYTDELRYLAQQLRLYAIAHERYDMVDFRRYLNGAPGGKLALLKGTCAECTRCPHFQSRKQVVFSRGDERSTLVFVGEAPGADEDAHGKPFVGDSGALLDKMIAKMRAYAAEIGVAFPEQPYICNVLKCRPPGNKLLNDGSDIEACSQWLWQQLRLLPNIRVIVALGRVAAQTLLEEDTAISRLRGKSRETTLTLSDGTPKDLIIVPTWHPSYLLRQPNNKQPRQESWSDLQRAVEALR